MGAIINYGHQTGEGLRILRLKCTMADGGVSLLKKLLHICQ